MSAEKLNPVNPGPLGLLGFGMTTILLNLHNAEIIPLSIVIVAMGLALGGAAQIIAGILEFCHGNTFTKIHPFQNIKLVIKVIEDDQSRMILKHFQNKCLPGNIRVRNLPGTVIKL